MKRAELVVPWKNGLHLRPASMLVKVASKFSSTIKLECKGKVATGRSIVSLLLLCATMGSTLQIETQGEDEDRALQAVQQVFTSIE